MSLKQRFLNHIVTQDKQQSAKLHTNFYYLILSSLVTVLCITIIRFFLIFPTSHYISSFNVLIYILILAVLLLIVAIFRNFYQWIQKILRSKRYDLIISVTLPLVLFFVILKDQTTSCTESIYFTLINTIHIDQYVLSVILILGWYLLILRLIKTKRVELKKKPLFLSDEPSKHDEIDLLDNKSDAEIFATQVLNNGHTNSTVFGLDAPWGAGKTTFLNYCKEIWKKHDVITVNFEALRFESTQNIFESFVKQLIYSIKEQSYLPEITNQLKKYGRLISNWEINFGFLKFTLPVKSSSDIELDKLVAYLESTQQKILVVVDDLDRLPIEQVKTILDVIKKSFVLPNISYIVCYDTENLNSFYRELITERERTYNVVAKEKVDENPKEIKDPCTLSTKEQEIDNKKIVEYLEKIVNVKKSLFIERGKIKDFFIKEMTRENYPLFSEDGVEIIKGRINTFFDADTFYQYSKYLGDLRKIKRFCNIIKLHIQTVDFSTQDIDFQDLLNLVLIYINYPKTFRKIYDTETEGGQGFFSLIYDYKRNSDSIDYKHSEKYFDYLLNLNEDEKFLVQRIFDKPFTYKKYELSGEIISTSAAFNGALGSGRNLENYLRLITKGIQADIAEQYMFHKKIFQKFIDGEKLEELFAKNEQYVPGGKNNNEKNIDLFFKITFDNLRAVSYENGKRLITFLADNLHTYSIVHQAPFELPLREASIYRLLKLLEEKSWKDPEGQQRRNIPPYINEIADWIYGNDNHQNILLTLFRDGSVLGLHDLLTFRLSCCADRGGGVFNIQRALNNQGPTSGDMKTIVIEEMRELSQICFRIFKNYFAENKISIFEKMDEVPTTELLGQSSNYLIESNKITKEKIESCKNSLVDFIIYQMTFTEINHGISCGYYDEDGTNYNHGIRIAFNEYLFNVCFSDDSIYSESKAAHFIQYLLSSFEFTGDEARQSEKRILLTLDETRLKEFWKNHGDKIKQYAIKRDVTIYSLNYTASYKEDLPAIFEILDNLIAPTPKPVNTATTMDA